MIPCMLQEYLKVREERYRVSSKEKAMFLSFPFPPVQIRKPDVGQRELLKKRC